MNRNLTTLSENHTQTKDLLFCCKENIRHEIEKIKSKKIISISDCEKSIEEINCKISYMFFDMVKNSLDEILINYFDNSNSLDDGIYTFFDEKIYHPMIYKESEREKLKRDGFSDIKEFVKLVKDTSKIELRLGKIKENNEESFKIIVDNLRKIKKSIKSIEYYFKPVCLMNFNEKVNTEIDNFIEKQIKELMIKTEYFGSTKPEEIRRVAEDFINDLKNYNVYGIEKGVEFYCKYNDKFPTIKQLERNIKGFHKRGLFLLINANFLIEEMGKVLVEDE